MGTNEHNMLLFYSQLGCVSIDYNMYDTELETILLCAHDISFKSLQLSGLMGKPTIYIGENKEADQLHGNREADQRLCFRNSDSTIPLLLKSEISSF